MATDREDEVKEAGTDAVLEQLRPYIRPDKREEVRLVLSSVVSKFHQGPIPPAEEMEHLDRVLPGAAERVMAMAEREQGHRHSMESSIVTKEFGLRTWGQRFAIGALALLLGGVAYLGYLGDTKSAAQLGIATIVGVVGIFVTGKYLEREPTPKPSEPEPDRRPQVSSRSERRNAEFRRR